MYMHVWHCLDHEHKMNKIIKAISVNNHRTKWSTCISYVLMLNFRAAFKPQALWFHGIYVVRAF